MSDTRLSFATATRLAAKLPALYANARAKYPPRQVESFIDFDELLLIYDAPLRHVESFIDFDELPSVYDVPLLLRSFNTFTLIDDSDTTLMMNRKTSLSDSFTVNLNETNNVGDTKVLFSSLKIGDLKHIIYDEVRGGNLKEVKIN
ncbi:hypothetical protein RhiirA4_476056, partial [Rhizophagus irregularis]